jgi:uracil phosphoribosyltransferase
MMPTATSMAAIVRSVARDGRSPRNVQLVSAVKAGVNAMMNATLAALVFLTAITKATTVSP